MGSTTARIPSSHSHHCCCWWCMCVVIAKIAMHMHLHVSRDILLLPYRACEELARVRVRHMYLWTYCCTHRVIPTLALRSSIVHNLINLLLSLNIRPILLLIVVHPLVYWPQDTETVYQFPEHMMVSRMYPWLLLQR